MLVLAGPGSGKTMVITERTRNLIKNEHVPASRILVITFTKAAAKEMKERFIKRMDGMNYPVTFGTFHGIFFGILRHAYGLKAENIISEELKYQMMHEIIMQHHLQYEDEKEFIGNVLSEISMMKNTGILLEHYYSTHCPQEVFRMIYESYQKRLQANRLLDFDDMLVYCYELLTQRPDILKGWQEKFQYILIDEFQDINKLQFDIIKLLAKPGDNLFVVGDDDQSIYRFRGAKPEIMLSFDKVYPDAKKVLLDVNYRSIEPLVEASLRLINHNEQRFFKKIAANRKGSSPVQVHSYQNQYQQNQQVIKRIMSYKEEGYSYGDIAVLFRTNTQPGLFMEQLMNYNIPFRTRDNVPNLYEHWIARDLFTYIRIALGSRKRGDFLKIMNRPNRYLTRESVEDSDVDFQDWIRYYERMKQPWVAERIQQLEADLRVLSRISPFAAVTYIRNTIGYEEYLKDYADYRQMNAEELIEVLDQLQNGAKGFRTYDEWFAHIDAYTKELSTLKEQREQNTDCVVLTTLHSSKGLEYPIVFILDVNEGIMPYKKATLQGELEEERRMFYVGVTRAKDQLHICHSKSMHGKEMEESRFIKELELPCS